MLSDDCTALNLIHSLIVINEIDKIDSKLFFENMINSHIDVEHKAALHLGVFCHALSLKKNDSISNILQRVTSAEKLAKTERTNNLGYENNTNFTNMDWTGITTHSVIKLAAWIDEHSIFMENNIDVSAVKALSNRLWKLAKLNNFFHLLSIL